MGKNLGLFLYEQARTFTSSILKFFINFFFMFLINFYLFIVLYVLLSNGTEYFFKPKLVGQRVQMHTLLVFLLIIGGLQLFGILGIIYGPLVVTGFLTLTDLYHASYQNLVEPSKT